METVSLENHLLEHLKLQEPDRLFERKVILPPNGDMLNEEIRSIDVVASVDPNNGAIAIHTFWKVNEKDIETLKDGGVVELAIMANHLHPISAQIWGGIKNSGQPEA